MSLVVGGHGRKGLYRSNRRLSERMTGVRHRETCWRSRFRAENAAFIDSDHCLASHPSCRFDVRDVSVLTNVRVKKHESSGRLLVVG